MKRPDLRLVPTIIPSCDTAVQKPDETRREMIPKNYQLSLPFEDQERENKLIVVVSMDRVHGSNFCKLILDLKPVLAIDLRHLIRFDLPGTNRTEVFQCFKVVHAMYINASLPWHRLTPRDFIAVDKPLSQRLHHEILERNDSPVLLLASKTDEARYLTSYLHRILSLHATHPWRVEQSD